MNRRTLLATPLLLATPALAQGWPTRPVTIIVPFAAGGNVDAIARLAAAELSRKLGQSVVVENAPGAGGTIGTERAARAAPDGHTLLLGVESPLVIAPFVTPGAVRYDTLADFAPVGMLASLPLTLVGRMDLGPADLAALVEAARAREMTYATSGTGTSLHLLGALIAQRTGARLEHVPYRIASQIPSDLIGGRLDLAVMTVTTTAPLIREGRIRGYGVSAAAPHPAIPDVPPLASLPALAGLELLAWQAILAPARTDPAIIARLAAVLEEVLADEAFRTRLTQAGMTPWARTPTELGTLLRAELARYGEVVRAGNIRAE
jgi:tripartite-type tricarboxylate transporter receptor subunit TctC